MADTFVTVNTTHSGINTGSVRINTDSLELFLGVIRSGFGGEAIVEDSRSEDPRHVS